ncbi:MAG: magnesium-translocating P-type ATPase [Anaerolineaceae bacterium]
METRKPAQTRTNLTPHLKSMLEQPENTLEELFRQLGSDQEGLSEGDAEKRLDQYGPNQAASQKPPTFLSRLWSNVKNPLVILLIVLGVVSYLTGDPRGAVVIGVMVLLGIVLRFVQESRADHAAEDLKKMVTTTTTVIRGGKKREIQMAQVVPGDILFLSAGDMVPADARVISTKDLFVNQAVLTGETMPVEKFQNPGKLSGDQPFEIPELIFQGTNVQSGSGEAVVFATGSHTFFGALAAELVGKQEVTSFDKGVNRFTWLMITYMAVMVPLVFLINGLFKHNWIEAFLFAVAVAVGMTPEMLPMIVTVNLSKGAIKMAKKKVIVKQLNAIQNFGAMDVLCTDKTGTLTQGKIVLEQYIDPRGNESDEVLYFAYLNSYYQTGLRNMMDEAVLDHVHLEQRAKVEDQYHKVDEIPFDFERRRMSVEVEDDEKKHLLITKGAVEEILTICTRVEVDGKVYDRKPEHDDHRRQRIAELNEKGFRVLALAYKPLVNKGAVTYSVKDESEMILMGFLAFLDPPKETTAQALQNLKKSNVDVKILTGDNDLVTATVCRKVGLSFDKIVLGSEIEKSGDDELKLLVETAVVFAKLNPSDKQRIIKALRANGHVVGFMGDGINDAPALKAADVGISVDTAVDIAKESSAIILLEQSLIVLVDGVLEGRKVFNNILKYIKMAASSSFGNMFSMLGGSIFLPFIPMLPIQILTNNLLYDFSQTTIPTDDVDAEWLEKPRKWEIGKLSRFILFFGPISSIFDYVTFFVMLYVFNAGGNAALFHTGWFVESLFTQTLIIHVIRTNKIPFIQSRASNALLFTSLLISVIGAILPYSPLASTLGFVPLPPLYWLILLGILLSYIFLTQLVKTWFVRKYGDQ